MSVLSSLSKSWRVTILGGAVALAAGFMAVKDSTSQTATRVITGQPIKLGIYGWKWTPFVLENPDVFDFVLYQMSPRKNEKRLDEIAAITELGVSMTVMQQVYPSVKERFMRDDAKKIPRPEQAAARIAAIYADPRTAGVQTISLDEENLWWNGRAEYLDILYRETKARLPDMEVWQWFNEHKTDRRTPRRERFKVATDGYILDPYSVPMSEYTERLRQYTRQGKPVMALLWAAPNWKHGGRRKGQDNYWWEEEGWRRLYEQVRLSRENGVDTALWLYDLPYGETEKFLTPIFLSKNPCSEPFLRAFIATAMPALRNAPLYDPTPAQRPSWMPDRCGNY